MQNLSKKSIFRICDANFNRAKEGLRTCEDICRFVWDDKTLTRSFKNIRHQLSDAILALKIKDIIMSRDIKGDVGKSSTTCEFKRKDVRDVFYANSQRAKESIRVLEEFTKLLNKEVAQELKTLRYQLYAVEHKCVSRC